MKAGLAALCMPCDAGCVTGSSHQSAGAAAAVPSAVLQALQALLPSACQPLQTPVKPLYFLSHTPQAVPCSEAGSQAAELQQLSRQLTYALLGSASKQVAQQASKQADAHAPHLSECCTFNKLQALQRGYQIFSCHSSMAV